MTVTDWVRKQALGFRLYQYKMCLKQLRDENIVTKGEYLLKEIFEGELALAA